MKKNMLTLLALLAVTAAMAKDYKTLVVTTQPQMHCATCENKIKGNLRFEKGVKRIETDVKNQRVTIIYDGEKNTAEQLRKAFGKIGYKATAVDAPAKKK